MRGAGSALFVSILLLIAGVLNIVYGIGAIADSKFYGEDTTIVFSSLSAWGWLTLIWGVVLILAGLSLLQGQTFGRIFGMVAAGVGAFWSLVAIGDTAYPFWNLGVFAICLIVIHGLAHLGEPRTTR